MATVMLPSLMRDATGGQLAIEVEGRTLRQVLAALTERYPALRERLWDEEGSLAPYLAIVVDGVETDDLWHEVGDQSEIVIIPAIGGGRESIGPRWAPDEGAILG